MSGITYTCAACNKTFEDRSGEDAMAEATATFTAGELADVDVVCDDCWRRMREAMPDLDARYSA